MNLDISGSSTALYSTFWMIEPLGLLFDCGDGAASFLQQKGRKVKYIACSHADRDHLTGLLQFIQVNSRPGFPTVHYPKDSGSFPALEAFQSRFDPHVATHARWVGVDSGECIPLQKGWYLEAYHNRHSPHEGGATKSLSFSLVSERRKLKAEYRDLPGPEIGKLNQEMGEDAISEIIVETALTYSGDTPLEKPEFWRNPRILIHEATFLSEETAQSGGQKDRHSVLQDVIEMATHMPKLEKLVLGHFSCRYDHQRIREAIASAATAVDLRIPVYGVTPGESKWRLFSNEPLWAPHSSA